MVEAIADQEARDGLRLSWNVFPSSKIEQQRLLLPLGCLYTPLKQVKDPKLVAYEPVRCRGMSGPGGKGGGGGVNSTCGAVLNPYSQINLQTKSWICPICGFNNQLSPFYAENITETQLPPEKQYSTIEYLLPNTSVPGPPPNANQQQQAPAEPDPPVFLFVLDTALNNADDEPEFLQAKDSLQQILNLIPGNSLVGLITFGALVNVYELGFTEIAKSIAFRGTSTKGFSAVQVGQQLGLPPLNSNDGNVNNVMTGQEVRRRFLLPISECEFQLNSIIDELSRDRWPSQGAEKRCGRCTGSALSVACGMIENLVAGKHESQITGGRIILLASGPCTLGPGTIVSLEKAEVLRSHQDLEKERPNTRHCKPAITYYASLAGRLVQAGFACDVFANSLDQIGSYELRVIPDRTGGVLVMSDGFSTNVFKDSFARMFSKVDENSFLQMGFNAKINFLSSKEIKVSGAIGALCSVRNGKPGGEGGPGKNPHQHMIGESEIGECTTTQWRVGALDPSSTISFFIEVVAEEQQTQGYSPPTQYGFIQFQTIYHHPSGARRLRITTMARQMTSDPNQLANSFDQEACACLVTRQALSNVEHGMTEEDVLRRMDRVLIRVISRFASYNKDDVGSFFLPDSFTFFPQFLFYLRRSPYVDLFNASPDETAYYRCCILRESTVNSLVMIQPALMEYSVNSVVVTDQAGGGPICEPSPVLLDSTSMKKDVILLMDSFFHVVIWRGATVQSWYDQGFHLQPEYENIKALIEQPALDARDILGERFPVPKFIQTHDGGSQARFLLCRVNPSRSIIESGGGNGSGGNNESSVVLTENANLKAFMQALIKAAVAS